MYRLGDDLLVRLPRTADKVRSVLKEQEWLPRLAPLLSVPVPEPVSQVRPHAVERPERKVDVRALDQSPSGPHSLDQNVSHKVVIDPQGRVAARILGQLTEPSILETLIKSNLPGGDSGEPAATPTPAAAPAPSTSGSAASDGSS